MAHTFNPSTWEADAVRSLSEFEASLVYRASSRTARAVTQRNPISINQTNKQTKEPRKNKQKEQKIKSVVISVLNLPQACYSLLESLGVAPSLFSV